MNHAHVCPVCAAPFTAERRAVQVRHMMARESPARAWKLSGPALVCQVCAVDMRPAAEDDRVLAPGHPVHAGGMEAGDCEACGVPVLLKPSKRRQHVVCSARCRTALRRRQSVSENVTRTCDGCGTELSGRADRRYCSSTCRQRAYRKRNGAAVTVGALTAQDVAEREAAIVNDLRLYLAHMGRDKSITSLSPAARGHIITALRETLADLESLDAR